MLKKLGKICGYIINILIAVIILTTTYSLIQIKILRYDYAELFGYTMFEVITGSMSGSVEIGDIVIVKVLNKYDELEKDQIIVFKQDNYIITHRLVEIDENSVITKGDDNNTQDKPIKKEDIIGEVIKVIPNVGIWKKVFTTPEVYISIITTLIFIGITLSYYKIDDKEKSIKERNDE